MPKTSALDHSATLSLTSIRAQFLARIMLASSRFVLVFLFSHFCSFAFDFNPALQPRSIVVLGCICKEADDRLVQKVLQVLIMVRVSFLFTLMLVVYKNCLQTKTSNLKLTVYLGGKNQRGKTKFKRKKSENDRRITIDELRYFGHCFSLQKLPKNSKDKKSQFSYISQNLLFCSPVQGLSPALTLPVLVHAPGWREAL